MLLVFHCCDYTWAIVRDHWSYSGFLFEENVLWICFHTSKLIIRRHKDSGVCKEAQTNMSGSDEKSAVSARRSYGHGRYIFW